MDRLGKRPAFPTFPPYDDDSRLLKSNKSSSQLLEAVTRATLTASSGDSGTDRTTQVDISNSLRLSLQYGHRSARKRAQPQRLSLGGRLEFVGKSGDEHLFIEEYYRDLRTVKKAPVPS